MTTLAATVAALAALSVSGVITAQTAPPQMINVGALPLSYVRISSMGDEVAALGGDNELRRHTLELVVIVAPVDVNTYAVAFASCVAIIDAIATALEARTIEDGWTRWTMTQEYVTVGTAQYWQVVARVEAM